LLLNLDKYYDAKNTEVKQKIIGSMFPEKLFFKDNEYRTTKLNEVVEILCKTEKALGQKKGGKKSEFSESSLQVTSKGVEPITFGTGNRHSIQLSYEAIYMLAKIM
jgi:site-specific DNA recombinase